MLKRRLYQKVLKKLLAFFKRLLGRKPKGHLFCRICSLAAYISGMIRNKSSHLSALGKGLLQIIKAHSRVKSARKFLYNKAVNYRTYYLPYVQELVKLMLPLLPNKKESIELVIDGSQLGSSHAILMISLVWGKRSIPLGWLIKKGAKGHFSKANHLEVVEQVQKDFADTFPVDKTVVLLGDGEFGSIELQQCCLDNNWNYVFRIPCNTILHKDGELFKPNGLGVTKVADYVLIASVQQDEQNPLAYLFTSSSEWCLPEELDLIPGQDHIYVDDVEFRAKRFKNVHFVLWHDPKYKKPLPLISNVDDASFIIKAYDKRWAVECLFKDLKSTSFKLDKTRLGTVKALDSLVMIAAFAFTILLKIGLLYKEHPIRGYIHQVRPDQVVCSIYTLGMELLFFFQENDIEFSLDEVVPIPIVGLK